MSPLPEPWRFREDLHAKSCCALALCPHNIGECCQAAKDACERECNWCYLRSAQ